MGILYFHPGPNVDCHIEWLNSPLRRVTIVGGFGKYGTLRIGVLLLT